MRMILIALALTWTGSAAFAQIKRSFHAFCLRS
jgi:hypothetical protein